MESVDILMATFNGGNYIENQIQSILSQTYRKWHLYIHDDGSSDNTLEIIKKYQKLDNRIELIVDSIKGLGPGRNFLHLLNYSKSKFICFSDQDDIWFENKLAIMISYIESSDISKPQLCCFNAYSWIPDDNNYIGKRSIQYTPSNRFEDYLLTDGGLQGSSIIFNKKLKDKLHLDYSKIYLHDYLITLYAVLFKCIHFHDIPLMLYRQHTNNTTGHIPQKYNYSFIREKLYSTIPVISKEFYNFSCDFYYKNKSSMSLHEKKLFEKFISLPSKCKINIFFNVFSNNFKIRGKKSIILSKVLIRPFMK